MKGDRMMTHRMAWLALVALAGVGCHEGDDGLDPADAPPAQSPAAVAPETLPPLAPPPPKTQLAVARTLTFARAADGVSLGFDLDDRISDPGDRESCGQSDYVGPDGAEGIDNAFSQVLPLIERFGGTALEGLVQAAINEGDLLVMLELDGVDSWVDDDEVSLTLLRGVGQPYVGTDDRLEPWQTYDVDGAAPWSRAEARIRGGVLEAGPVEFDLPIYVFDFEFLVTVTEARVRVVFDDEGPDSAVLGGTITMENLLHIANNIEGGAQIPGILDTVGRSFADMDKGEDGFCGALSVVLDIDLEGAFFYDDVERPDR